MNIKPIGVEEWLNELETSATLDIAQSAIASLTTDEILALADDEQVAEAVKNGICKVNYATELRQAYTKGYMAYMAENPNNFDPKNPGKAGAEEITKIVKIRMENLGSVGRA